jgi:REP element-mobilizing transposase RayT
MSRPLRIEFAGALYHVTSRGDRREPIYEDDEDRHSFLNMLGTVTGDFNWVCHAYCLMGNHYHLLVETPDGNLGRGMRQLNGVYTQWSNRRHRRVGHLFQGRYQAILVDKDSYLLELCRYVVLNPVRAGMVKKPGQWAWSSYRAMMGVQSAPPWLSVQALLAHFGRGLASARAHYERFVAQGMKAKSPWESVKGQLYLGDDGFVERMQRKLGSQADDINIPRAQRRKPAPALAQIERVHKERNRAILAAHDTGRYSYVQIGKHFGVHFTTVGRIVRAGRQGRKQTAKNRN